MNQRLKEASDPNTSPNTSPDLLAELARDLDTKVCLFVARNQSLPEATLKRLAADPD